MNLANAGAVNAGHLLNTIRQAKGQGPFLSIYLAWKPDESKSATMLRLNRLLSQARSLLKKDNEEDRSESYLEPIRRMILNEGYKPQAKGLGFFCSKDGFYFCELDVVPPEITVVADSYHIKPLLQSVLFRTTCYIVTISARRICLFKASRHAIVGVRSMSNQMSEESQDRQRMLVGQAQRPKELAGRFLAKATQDLLKDVDLRHQNVAIFGAKMWRKRIENELISQANAHVFFQGGMPSSIQDIKDTVLKQLERKLKRDFESDAARIVESTHPGFVSRDLKAIAAAAIQGRISTLIVEPGLQVWGDFDKETGSLEIYPEQRNHRDDCVIDDIIELVMQHKGDVVFAETPQTHRHQPTYTAVMRW